MEYIAHIRSAFPEKFGIPRQSGLVQSLRAEIVFEEKFRNPDALRGIGQFSHLWLIWEFSEAKRANWSPTVRPPRLGGNERLGVFATRSPFRPNPIGLSCVKLEEVDMEGMRLVISGADLMDGTPIFDIKPYIPYADSHPDASGGFAQEAPQPVLQVHCADALLEQLNAADRSALLEVLALDPRPSYQSDPQRIYGMDFAGFNVRFRVEAQDLTVTEIQRKQNPNRA